MLKLIKEAQAKDTRVELIVEACKMLKVPHTLLESLDGVLQQYVQRINSGQMKNLSHDDIYGLANIFAFSSMIGVIDAPSIDANAAQALINLYKRARPGDTDAIGDQIQNVVRNMEPDLQTKFKKLANVWGRSLSQTIQNPTPEAMKAVSNRLLKAVYSMEGAMNRLQDIHGEDIFKSKVRAGQMSRRLGLSPT